MKTRALKRCLLIFVPVLGGAVLLYKLFEPVFFYSVGWAEIPSLERAVTALHAPGWEEVGAQADAWLEESRRHLDTPALSAAVSVGGELVWAGAAGYADLDSRTKAALTTSFRLGSSSKAVTSVAMGVLIDERAIDIDAPVSRYVSSVTGLLASITTRQAMSHTGGVRDYGHCLCFPIWEYYNKRHYSSQREALRPFERSKLLFVPGESFAYTSYGYNLTGAVIEGVTGVGFGEFLKARLFDPLGMVSTRPETGLPGPADATFYELRGAKYKQVFPVDNTNKLPSGGMVSTPSDMVRLGREMITPSLFSEEARDLLITHQSLADGRPNPQGYALGWRSHELPVLNEKTTRVLHHHGVAYGAVSHFAVYPEYGVVVSIMMNRNQGAFGEAPGRLAALFISAADGRVR